MASDKIRGWALGDHLSLRAETEKSRMLLQTLEAGRNAVARKLGFANLFS
jgi:hypothetical protein